MAKVKYWDRLKKEIERGEQGLNTGIPFEGFTTLSDHIQNIQQRRYDLIFAPTSIGKSAFLDSTYVYGAINFLQSNPGYIHDLEIIYYSLEIPPEDQIAKHIVGLLWKEHGILSDVNEIKSKGNKQIRPEVKKLLLDYEDRMNEIQDSYIRFKTSLSPKSLFRDLVTYAEKRGVFQRDEEGNILSYTPNNPGLITLVIIDHIGHINYKDFNSKKEAIDMASKHLVFFRNMCNFSPVVVSQINRDKNQKHRQAEEGWMPELQDIKDTGNLAEDANTVMGLESPFYVGVDNCLGYDITKFKDRYRLLKILKNRDGKRNLLVSFLFIGEYGGYYQLPPIDQLHGKPEELKKIDEYYVKTKINQV
jgi:replicative DNA helicase